MSGPILSDVETGAEEDAVWIRLILSGKEEVYAHLVAKYKSRVRGLVFRFSSRDQDREDLCQEVFIRAYRKLALFRGGAPFEHWLMKVATNCCYAFLRKNRKHQQADLLVGQIPEIIDQAMERRVSQKRAQELLEIGMSRLSAEERLVITLLELEDKSVREIMDLTGWSESRVKTKAHRARQAMANTLELHHE